MNYFFVFFIQFVLPISLLLAVNWSKYPILKAKQILWLSLIGFLLGVLIQLNLPVNQSITLGLNLIQVVAFVGFAISLFISSVKLANVWQVFFMLMAGTLWAKDPNIAAITNTDVINTDFILHLSAVVLGWLFCLVTAGTVYFLLQQTSKTTAKFTALLRGLLLLLLICLLLPLLGDILLSLMKLQVIELTKLRLSFVAKSGIINLYLNLISAGLLALVLLLFMLNVHFVRRQQALKEPDPILKRKKQAAAIHSQRTLIWGGFAVILIIASQLYWDQIASRPPQLSEATPVTLNQEQAVQIPINQVKDGKLHRFVWIADDGKAVRFFVINRQPDRLSLGVVFDACLLCGDQGYVMEGNQVVCVGCGVHLFIPSIGKPGGCNPVPIEDWQQTADNLIISRKSLEEGLNLFSTIVEIEVQDPVSGEKVKNTKTDYKYNYEGKTYFFASEQNLAQFRDHPEKFLPTHKEPQ